VTDTEHTVTGWPFIDERGAPYDFSTTDRHADLPGGRGRTPVQDWDIIDGRPTPGQFGAVWHLPQGWLPTSPAD